jgi:hypothetical protein
VFNKFKLLSVRTIFLKDQLVCNRSDGLGRKNWEILSSKKKWYIRSIATLGPFLREEENRPYTIGNKVRSLSQPVDMHISTMVLFLHLFDMCSFLFESVTHNMEFPLWQNEVYEIQINFIKSSERLGAASVVYGLARWPLVPKFTGSNPAEAVRFFRVKKSSARLPSEGK